MMAVDYMNSNLVYLRAGDRVEVAHGPMLDFGLTAVPILDADHKPVGMVTLGAVECLVTVAAGETIQKVASLMTESSVHHAVVIDAEGRAMGILSSLDVIRGLVGARPKHPSTIRRFVDVAREEAFTRTIP